MAQVTWRRSLCVLLASLLAHTAWAEVDTPASGLQSLFAKMSRVSHSLNYRGSFTYEYFNSPLLQSFRVSHWVADQVEYERLEYLNGPEREVVRSGQQLDCLTPGDQLLQGRLTRMGSRLEQLDNFYQVKVLYEERVAGRAATRLQVAPRDNFRHGFLLSVDQETGLVLSSLMVDASGRVLERYQFIELEILPDASELAQQPPAPRQRQAKASPGDCNQTEVGEPNTWQLSWVPPGFVFAGQQKTQASRDMLMYTDGMTTFSVFIEPTEAALPELVGHRGATLALMSRLTKDQELYRVTVVGEIPQITAEHIAQGVRAQDSQ